MTCLLHCVIVEKNDCLLEQNCVVRIHELVLEGIHVCIDRKFVLETASCKLVWYENDELFFIEGKVIILPHNLEHHNEGSPCTFCRALELAVNYRTHVDTVLWKRKKYLDSIKREETNKKFLQYSQSVQIDEEAIRSKVEQVGHKIPLTKFH